MLDSDLANLYGVTTKQLNQQVKRNLDRFPTDFIYQLTKEEYNFLSLQYPAFRESTGWRKYFPCVFTEQGIAMLSSVLTSKRAIQVNITIMRTFIKLRKIMLESQDVKEKLKSVEKGANRLFRIIFDRLGSVEKDVQILKIEIPSLPLRRKKIGLE